VKYNKNTEYKIITNIFTAEICNSIKISDYLITTPENVFSDILKHLATVCTANIMRKLIDTKIFGS
jgi:hypothetical protein